MPGLGRRSQSNVRRATSRANRTNDHRETDPENSRIDMSELRYLVSDNKVDRLRMQRVRAPQTQQHQARHNEIELIYRRNASVILERAAFHYEPAIDYCADKSIDLKDAYLQMELDDDSKAIMVVNTPLGLYQYQRLPYGIASATAIFQRYLEQLIQGIEGCGNYLDGIIITAPTFDEHMQRVENILQVLQSNGIKCKQQKCFFLQEKIEYLGRQISAGGILPDEFGLVAVRDLKPLKNIKQVEAFMDICPINMLRRKNVPFTWGPKQQQAFTSLKHLRTTTSNYL
ncbi:uncharacterized protein K02A2.6-like [Anastrepha ludens]|uniref:uncharacterized protein K02A2.6-like n=1 Tax=Anastrepha ludens TaxID=28586 RepID=UPI0023AEE379|nr:uncharacterized protein K02A2.6-like [Anastrepha ludens]